MSYSRNKYRCLLGPSNQNVIVSNDNNIKLKPTPQPNIYPYDGVYPCYGPYGPYGLYGGYPGYLPRPIPYVDTMPPISSDNPEPNPTPEQTIKPNIMYPYYDGLYPGLGYPGYGGLGYPGYRGYESGYFPGYGRGYGPYSYAKESNSEPKISPKTTPKTSPEITSPKMNPHCYYSSDSSDSSDSCDSDSFRRYRYRYRNHVTPGINPENSEIHQENSGINPENPEIHQENSGMNLGNPEIHQENLGMHQENQMSLEKNKHKNYSKPFVKLLAKLTTPITSIPTSETNLKIEESLGKDENNLVRNEIQNIVNDKNDNEQKIYLK
jgi:hypothetical protein